MFYLYVYYVLHVKLNIHTLYPEHDIYIPWVYAVYSPSLQIPVSAALSVTCISPYLLPVSIPFPNLPYASPCVGWVRGACARARARVRALVRVWVRACVSQELSSVTAFKLEDVKATLERLRLLVYYKGQVGAAGAASH